jgi:signal transduction histidine kinase
VSGPERALYLLAYLAIFTLVIGLVSWWAARQLIWPLNRLAQAVRRLGQTRQMQPIEERGPEEVRVIARSVNDMQQRIKRFLDERTAMAGAMSHDLRTPLTRLRLRAELTQDQELRAKLLADVADIELIVEDALALARFDAPAEQKALLDLSSLLHGLVDDGADAGQALRFAGVEGIRVDGHPVALKRAFANLIDNAAKYGGGAEVALRAEGGEAIVTISDQGPGIADADKERVFEAFHRLEASRNRDTGGSGLGLTIARSIIETHGGSIALADAKPHGLVVSVRLPLSAA